MIKKRLLLVVILLIVISGKAQVGIGTTNPNALLDISASDTSNPTAKDGLLIPKIETFPSTNPAAAQQGMLVYLTTTSGTNLPGFYFWDNTTTSWKALENKRIVEDIDADTKIQLEETTDEDIIRFDMAGVEYFTMQTGRIEVQNTGNSIFIGDGAGANDDFTDNNNVFIGENAGNANETGFDNVAIGYNTLSSNIASKNSVAIGWEALTDATDGHNNTAVGNASLWKTTTGYTNTALGSLSGGNNTTGYNNVFIGAAAGKENTTGRENTLIGFSAGKSNVTGRRNIMIGRVAGENATGSSNVFIGNGAGRDETGDNKLYIDNSNTTSPLLYGDFSANTLTINGDLGITHPAGRTLFPSWNSINNTTILQTYDGFIGQPQVRYFYNSGDTYDMGLDGSNNFILEQNDTNILLIDTIGNITSQGNLTINEVLKITPTATAPTSPTQGTMYYDSVANKLKVYDGSVWQECW